ncbi:MAG: peptide ABC transporter permease [Sulfurovum sp. PC08-66]|nr:MAG: peptide ABC transporter permease [Sulfurovum sp. PC08-66]KIM12627.1 MAG: peptide ABC transporter permease [Sulfuricurvum sp. PC08-66]
MRQLLAKIGYLAGMLWLISVISFLAIHAAPHSFFSAGELNPNMTPQALEHLARIYGLDKPLWEQYLSWMVALLTFDFGLSFVTGKKVIVEIQERIGITLFLNTLTLFATFALALWLGIKAALSPNSTTDKRIKTLSLISFAMPSFYLAIVLILLFGVYLEWTPIAGLHSIDIDANNPWLYYIDMAWHLLLPLSVMIFVSIGSMTLYVRSLAIDIAKSDYLFLAKARNLPPQKIIRFYIIPNLLPPIVTLLGLSLPALIGGSVILEKIFAIDGMGNLFFTSAMSRDYPVIMGILIITAFLTLLGNMLSDMVLMRLNPFFKQSKQR